MPQENIFKKILKFLKKPWVIVSLVILVIIILIVVFSGGKKTGPETVKVTRGDITEEVSATGNVKPVQSVDLAFQGSGRIAAVNADVGDKVYSGEAVVVLDKSDLEAQLAKAQADLATQNASLNKAQVDLQNEYSSVANILSDAYIKSDDAVRVKTSSLFTGSQTSGYQSNLNSCDAQTTIDSATLRGKSETNLILWQKELATLDGSSSSDVIKQQISDAESYLNVFKNFLGRTNDNLTSTCIVGNTSYDAARANVTLARNNVSAALTNVMNQQQMIGSQEATIASLTAGVGSYQAGADNIKAQISNMTIYAPISGIVTVQNAKVGEIAPAGSVMVSIISASNFEVEANVAEADIAKIQVGDPTDITLDTYGNDVVFQAKVSSVDPAETMVEGVATYKTKFQFLQKDDRVKSGMTANITVYTAEHKDVLILPQRAVGNDNGQRTVLFDLGNGKSEERNVQTGLRGADGNIEITGGLNEGDTVIISNS